MHNWNCPSAGGACTNSCGDGIRAGAEVCDDGNYVSGDGCAANCGSVETGF